MAVILLALDESGKLDNTEDVVFGGCMFENAESHRFGEKWNGRLDESRIYSLHMKDAMRLGGDFRGWNEPGRDNLLRGLATLAAQSRPMPMLVAAPMSTKEFRALPQADQERLKNPVYCGFEGCVRAAVDSIPRGEPHSLQIVCDLSEEYSVQVLRLFHKLRSRSEEVKRRCHGLFFADDRYVPILQLADMFAYVCRAFHAGKPPEIILDILELLTGKRTIESKSRMVYEAGEIDLGSGLI
jgi:hypothetical protein